VLSDRLRVCGGFARAGAVVAMLTLLVPGGCGPSADEAAANTGGGLNLKKLTPEEEAVIVRKGT